jgi:hypothetical protein
MLFLHLNQHNHYSFQVHMNAAKFIRWLIVALFCCVAMVNLSAQTYSIDWYTIDGGGGTSKGGVYTLSGTIGQPDAHTASGGGYTLQGGFWPGMTIPGEGELPTLYIDRAGQMVVITWDPAAAGYSLESTLDLSHPAWTITVPDQPGSATIPALEKTRYFRLRKP